MIDLPHITIVMPSYNQSRYIEEAIQSILDQNYPNLEFMILDGDSQDGSQEIIKHYSDHLTYWQSQRDKGQTDALIQGFSRATGELWGWLNSDDVLLPGALYHIAKAFKSHPKGGLFGGNVLEIDEQSNIILCRRPISTVAMFARYGLFAIAQPGSFFTRRDYEAIGGLHSDLQFIMDVDLYMRMLKNHVRYIKVNAWVSGFRFHSLSKTVLHSSNFTTEYESVRQRYLPWTKPSAVGLYLFRSMQTINGNYFRMFIETYFARGKHWRDWCKRNLDVY
jgi:glycosyltransferase involved in cell wall biosynthesis